MREPLWLMVSGLLWLSLSPSEVLACRCVKDLTLRQTYAQAAVVVIGQVISIEVIDKKTQTSKTVLSVETAWKGSVPNNLTVYTDGTCAFQFINQQKYLLYLTKSKAETFGTSKCVGNEEVELAGKHVRWLQRYGKRSTVS
jgi:hypothetical protein